MKVFIVNAFARNPFGGNPAAIVPLRQWLPEAIMQQIAMQHNLAETAFVVPEEKDFRIRWFTPTVEVDLCGHATLAAAHVYFNHLGYDRESIVFHSRSGPLSVTRRGDGQIVLDFPVHEPVATDPPPEIEEGLKRKPLAVFKSTFDYMALFESQWDIEQLSPDFKILGKIKSRGLITTAKGEESDFVSRCFFPQSGIDEDPVTGSAHTVMVPYWARVLNKTKLSAIQLSARKGYLDCECLGDRVLLAGRAQTYLEGEIIM
jgi:PhzF family phenazine biosynthesis protein